MLLDFVNSYHQEFLIVIKSYHDRDRRDQVTPLTDNHVAHSTRIVGQDGINGTCQYRCLDIKSIQIVGVHLIIGMFGECVLVFEDSLLNSLE